MPTVEDIQQDVACPQCEYNLRGLRGSIVGCPECGATVDVARLIARQWTGPWYKVPGLNRLYYPVAWLAVGALLAAPLVPAVMSFGGGEAAFALAAPVYFGGWLVLIQRAHALFNYCGAGITLSLLGHVLFAGYIAGAVGMIWGIVYMFSEPTFYGVLTCVISFIAGVGLILAARRGERFIGGRCIKRYLDEISRVAA